MQRYGRAVFNVKTPRVALGFKFQSQHGEKGKGLVGLGIPMHVLRNAYIGATSSLATVPLHPAHVDWDVGDFVSVFLGYRIRFFYGTNRADYGRE